MRAALRRPEARRWVLVGLGGVLLASVVAAAGVGPLRIAPLEVVGLVVEKLGGRSPWPVSEQAGAVFWAIRVPRVALASLVGAGLATGGAALQGLFRNPLADPTLIGVSSGASLGAVMAIGFGSLAFGSISAALGLWLLPAMAFVGGLAATAVCLRVGRVEGQTRTPLMLLAGIAVNALSGAGIGLAMHVVSDAQLRNLTFWMLGSLGGATVRSVALVGPILLGSVFGLLGVARSLNALLLGEREAHHLGVSVERVRLRVVLLTALAVGASVGITGMIGFVGLVVPHLVRTLLGPDHRRLLPASALAGATLLVLADLGARTVAAPAELPVGVVTALLGAPFFLWQLHSERSRAAER